MPKIVPVALDWKDRDAIAAAERLIIAAFNDPRRYAGPRISEELRAAALPHYRQFFGVWSDGRLVGVGGSKSADWASDTHILYLSSVDADHRGKGIGRALVGARIEWILERHPHGRILVSTNKPKRYRALGFGFAGRIRSDAPSLMVLDF